MLLSRTTICIVRVFVVLIPLLVWLCADDQAYADKTIETSGAAIASNSPTFKSSTNGAMSSAQLYTNFWIEGKYEAMIPYISPLSGSSMTLLSNKEAFLRFLTWQRKKPPYAIPSTAHIKDLHLEPISAGALSRFLNVALSLKATDSLEKGTWPVPSQDAFAMVVFSLQNKRYCQIWYSHNLKPWQCLNLPIDLDESVQKQIRIFAKS